MVGAVLVRAGQDRRYRFPPFAGGDHAEIVALKARRPEGAWRDALYTLEPCSHQGRTAVYPRV